MRFVVTNAILWAIAIISTVVLTRGTGLFTMLGPVYSICMIGSIATVRRAASQSR